MAVHVIVRDDAGHRKDLDAPRPRTLIELPGRERRPDRTAHRDVGQAAKAGEDDAVANAAFLADLLDRFEEKLAVREPHHDNLACARPACNHSLSRHDPGPFSNGSNVTMDVSITRRSVERGEGIPEQLPGSWNGAPGPTLPYGPRHQL